MKILLTGHEGYLGSRLLSYFQEQGHAVIGIGREKDIGKITRALFEAEQIELVVNCATAANRLDHRYVVGGADEEVNLLGTRQLILALKDTDIGFIHVSTKDVYGNVYKMGEVTEISGRLVPSFAVDEQQPFRPETIYAKTKLMAEFIAESHARTTILRLSTGYTSDLHRRGNWILNFCRAAKNGSPVRINGSGMQLRDPLHADDLGDLMLLLAEKNIWGVKLNVGAGFASSHSILEVLDMIDAKHPREFSPGGDLGYVSAIELAQGLSGWQPARSFSVELRKLIGRVKYE